MIVVTIKLKGKAVDASYIPRPFDTSHPLQHRQTLTQPRCNTSPEYLCSANVSPITEPDPKRKILETENQINSPREPVLETALEQRNGPIPPRPRHRKSDQPPSPNRVAGSPGLPTPWTFPRQVFPPSLLIN